LPTESAPSHVIVSGLESVGATVSLSPEESHYLLRVCRVRAGDRVIATDGLGTRSTVRVLEARSPVTAEIESLDRQVRRCEAWVMCGVPEGERADWMVEKLAELGVAAFQPIECDRGGWGRAGLRMDRWQRLARAALRQSQGRFAMELRPPTSIDAALDALAEGAECWLAAPSGAAAFTCRPRAEGVVTGAVGPSSGFAPRELRILESRGFSAISLSTSRLRTETAALAWSAWWAASTGFP